MYAISISNYECTWNVNTKFTHLKNCIVDIQQRTSLPDFSANAIKEPKSLFNLSFWATCTRRSARRAESMGGKVTTKAICLNGLNAGS